MRFTWFLLNKRMNCKNILVRKFYSFLIMLLLNRKSSYIGSGAKFKNKPVFPHFSGIFISGGAKIGENAIIYHQVTIGASTLSDSKHKGSPSIGDNCFIGAGAKIIGNIKIGNNVRIGANCVIVKDVPDDALVVNQAPRIIIKENIDNKYISYKMR